MDCVNDRSKEVNAEITADRLEWKRKTCCADPTYWDNVRNNNKKNL